MLINRGSHKEDSTYFTKLANSDSQTQSSHSRNSRAFVDPLAFCFTSGQGETWLEWLSNEITQIFQFNSQINIMNYYMGRHLKNDGSKIEYGLNSGSYQLIGNGLRASAGNGQDR